MLSDKRPQELGSPSLNEDNEDNEDNANKTDNAETTSPRLSNPDNVQILLLRNSMDIVSLFGEVHRQLDVKYTANTLVTALGT